MEYSASWPEKFYKVLFAFNIHTASSLELLSLELLSLKLNVI